MFERDDKTARFFIDSYGPDDAAVQDGLRWLARFAMENGCASAAIWVSGMSQVDQLGAAASSVTVPRNDSGTMVRLWSETSPSTS